MMAIPKQGPVVAIDGPAGTGKSSVTKELARRLDFTHVDTGALYRCIAWLSLEKATSGDESELTQLASNAHIEFANDRIIVNGTDVTDAIRTERIGMQASRVSSVPGVRAALLGQQRRLGCQGRTILEGRDIGTVIFPDADIKFFLTASSRVRAERRLQDLKSSGDHKTRLEDLIRQIDERDQADATRKAAPLKRAKDALLIDTSDRSFEEVVTDLEATVKKQLGL